MFEIINYCIFISKLFLLRIKNRVYYKYEKKKKINFRFKFVSINI